MIHEEVADFIPIVFVKQDLGFFRMSGLPKDFEDRVPNLFGIERIHESRNIFEYVMARHVLSQNQSRTGDGGFEGREAERLEMTG